MKRAVDGLKWVSVSITVASLVMVFWVWPAWNAGSQTWYLGNNSALDNTMYRNTPPPSGFNAPFQFVGSFEAFFKANEAATQMLTFGGAPWQYQIEWYLDDPMGTFMGTGMEMVMYSLTIGRWNGMSMMLYNPVFSAMGSGGLGSMLNPFRATGAASSAAGMMTNFAFMPGDILGAMVMFMTSPASYPLVVPLANTCFITSPLADPGYPGFSEMSVPTLSQWGMLVLAILLPLLYPFVIKRRIRIGRS